MKFENFIFQTLKVMEFNSRLWKVMEKLKLCLLDQFVHTPKQGQKNVINSF